MPYFKNCLLVLFSLFFSFILTAQESAFKWEVTGIKKSAGVYEIEFKTPGNSQWQLYGANEQFDDVPSVEIELADSSIKIEKPFLESGQKKTIQNPIFNNSAFTVYTGPAVYKALIRFSGPAPSNLLGVFRYTYGRNDEFYPLTPLSFSVPLEGGVANTTRIKIESFDLKNPTANCGDDNAGGQGMMTIFLLGLVGGFIALLTPCVFPLIPLTVSFFTKKSSNRTRGIGNAVIYGFFIFLIYILLSLPFHFVNQNNPEILNNISTNVWLNLLFFVIFIVFAISFFGFFEIRLPGSIANKADSKSGIGNLAGIFFMALTLAIVSFSCTGPILGSLLVGALSNNGGAMQLTFGMAGFGLGLALPFAIFAMFPNWLHSLPKSGGWLTSVKVVLGFLELAMAIKFLSNADLVEQWKILPREIFIGSWVVIGICIVLYLLGKIRFPHDGPVKKISNARWAFITLFSLFTLYLIPGLTNTRFANLKLISGFPPPLCYSVYSHPVNCESGIEPLRDYEEAIQRAKKENKPLLIDFTGWACVNCRRMEENVWTDPTVNQLMKNEFVIVSLYVDERKKLPASQQLTYTTKTGAAKRIITVGDKWATFQSENFDAVAQPQYAMICTDEKALTKTKAYTPDPKEFAEWLQCGLTAFRQKR